MLTRMFYLFIRDGIDNFVKKEKELFEFLASCSQV